MTTKNAGFEWNKETTEKAVSIYQAKVEAEGCEVANTNDSLGEIAKAVGAKSAQAIRSKLSTEKVYQKAAKARRVGGVVKTAKVHYIRALQNFAEEQGVELSGRKLESLEQGTTADLQNVITMLETVSGEKIAVGPEPAAPKTETAKA